ncbi:DeoR/GlpR family DNA-binding transcription regulator [Christensenella intestinihominis]|uniref:DeoR/GlpR family DNA-binding transcription regulator n=1 Tax=Christensenella intestinihominis TaxID=1851429 RepID=UPI000A7D66E0|nr:DeoR/GlpR family DNA-binding transcription regulator [Christensenella intestinihominis]
MADNNKAARLELQDYAFSKKGIRQNRILFLLLKHKSMSNKELCDELKCSEATIRNDLRELDHLKLIKRVFGGAKTLDDTYGCIPMSEHLEYAYEEKEAIAAYVVANILKPNQSVVLDMGSTCLALARQIAQLPFDINVVTNSLLNAEALSKNPHVYLSLPGGTYNITADTFDSARTLEYYDNIHPDYYLMSANGLTADGITITMTADSTRSIIKQRIAQSAEKVILLCDHNKLNKTCFYKICDIGDIDLIVTDDKCSPEERNILTNLGVEVAFAPTVEPVLE